MSKADCIFCAIAAGRAPSWRIYEDEHNLGFLNINPVSRFHSLVIPKRHSESVFDIPETQMRSLYAAVHRLAGIFRTRLGIEHVHVLSNSGWAAQQTVFHVHVHLIPRSPGDNMNIVWHPHPEWRVHFDDWQRMAGEGE